MKYTVTYSCGHTGTVQLYGKTEERERKIKYYEEYGLCPECYKKQKQEENEKMGLLLCSTIEYELSGKGEIQVRLSFRGDTKPHKEEIKALGYRWTVLDDTQILSTARPEMGWVKIVPHECLEEEKGKAFSIGARETTMEEKEKLEQKSRFEEMLAAQILFKKQHGKELQKQKERETKLADLLKEEPDLIKGKKWNQKIYGKSGNYSIYPDGEKVNISDEEAEELKKYLKDFREKMKEEAGID